MENTEEISASFWVEKDSLLSSHEKDNAMQSKRCSFSRSLKPACEKWLSLHKINHTIFLNAVFGLLCNHYIASSVIAYGFGRVYLKRNRLYLKKPLIDIVSKTNDTLTVMDYLHEVSSQLKNIPNEQKHHIRYLLLEKSTGGTRDQSPIEVSTNEYPLIVIFEPKKLSSLSFYYNQHVLDADIIQGIFDHLSILIDSIITGSTDNITQLNILTNEEKLFYQNQPILPSCQGDRFSFDKSLGELFSQIARSYGNQFAVYHNEERMTYAELDTLSSLTAKYLISLGVGIENTVCVYSQRNILLIIYMIAIFKVGAIFVPIDARHATKRVELIASNSEASVILSDQSPPFVSSLAAKYIQFQSVQDIYRDAGQFAEIKLPSVPANSVAYIVYTSGTTGQPKGVMIEHRSLINLANFYYSTFKISDQDNASQFSSHGFDTFFCETIPFFLTGATVHLIDDQIKMTPTLFFEWLDKHQITICDVPTAYAKVLFSLQWPSLPMLKMVKIGGENVNRYPDKIFSFDIWNTYGPSEATIETTFKKIYSAYSPPNHDAKSMAPPIGTPLKNASIWVVDQFNQLVPHGVAGELLISGINLAQGYWRKPELTSEKFIIHAFKDNEDLRLYKTGDLVKLSRSGNLEYLGRTNQQVTIQGYRVQLSEVEAIMNQYPDVSNVVVIVKETANHQKQIYAYITPDLDKQRFIFQERCLLKVKDRCFEALTENLSKKGLRLSSVSDQYLVGELVTVELRLPGAAFERSLRGHVIWQQNDQCGIAFDLNDEEQRFITRSIQFYLSSQNTQDIISRSTLKRSIKAILKAKLPQHMVPASIVTLLEMPTTLSGKIDKYALPDPEVNLQHGNEIIHPTTEKERKLLEIWTSLLHRNNISLSDSFFDLGGNSLLVAELSINILETFGVLIPVHILFDLPYLSIQAEYLETGGTKYNRHSYVQELIAKDVVLPENLHAIGRFNSTVTTPTNILLTGADTFLGIFLLKSLLSHTDATIYCLLTNEDFQTPVSHLMSLVNSFYLQDYISLSNQRIVIIGGDLALDNLGLPAVLYESLSKKIDLIFHCGAQENTMSSYDRLRVNNVFGTLGIIKFAVHHVDKPIHYVSTLFAASHKNEAGEVDEVSPLETEDQLVGGFALSKWVAERLLVEITQRGVPVVIYRTGNIGGWSEQGVANVNDTLLMLLKGCIQLGVAPLLHEQITFLPVDFIARAITTFALKTPMNTAIYHVTHPVGINWLDLVEWINQYGYKLQVISLPRWQKLLSMLSKQNVLYPLLPHYLSLKEGNLQPHVSTTHFIEKLLECHLELPEINSTLLTLYFDFLRSINFLSPVPVVKSIEELSKN